MWTYYLNLLSFIPGSPASVSTAGSRVNSAVISTSDFIFALVINNFTPLYSIKSYSICPPFDAFTISSTVGKLQIPPGIGRVRYIERAQFANRARAFIWDARENNVLPLRHRCSFFKAEPFEEADPALMHVPGIAV